MAQIIPIRDLRNTTEISNMCNETNEPIYITKNGYGDLVVMSMKAYEERFAKLDIVSKIRDAELDIENGSELLDGKQTLHKLRAKYVQ